MAQTLPNLASTYTSEIFESTLKHEGFTQAKSGTYYIITIGQFLKLITMNYLGTRCTCPQPEDVTTPLSRVLQLLKHRDIIIELSNHT